jgi:protein TonB
MSVKERLILDRELQILAKQDEAEKARQKAFVMEGQVKEKSAALRDLQDELGDVVSRVEKAETDADLKKRAHSLKDRAASFLESVRQDPAPPPSPSPPVPPPDPEIRPDGGEVSKPVGQPADRPAEVADKPVLPSVAVYSRDVAGRLGPLTEHSFPRSAILEGRGGCVTVQLTIQADGSLTGVDIVRMSGIRELDDNVVRAVRAAGPFPPLPEDAPRPFRLNVPFDFTHPAVSGPADR